MKKLLVNLGLVAALSTAAVAKETDLFISDVEYFWNVQTKACTKSNFKSKKVVMDEYNSGKVIINKQYKNEAGTYTWLEGEDKDGPYSIDVFSTYGECKAYEQAIINKQKIVDWNYFANMKDPNVVLHSK